MSKQVSYKIRMERLRKSLSQQNMADELGITVAAYSNLERGVTEITVKRLYQIAKILKLDPHDLLEEDKARGEGHSHDHGGDSSALSQQLFLLIQEVERIKSDVQHLKEIQK
jgi:transcriptional regulator with XRE-family HTH domain